MARRPTTDPISAKVQVRETYASMARQFAGTGCASCCGPEAPQPVPVTESCCPSGQAALPAGVTGLSLGCDNPVALADLQPGQVVLDVGSGGGVDVFLAAQRVGPTGRAIGVDMTAEMIDLARWNARQIGAENVEFHLGEIGAPPVPDGSVDVIISNCVINLSPDKDAVFAEAYRVLKPGGRVIIADIVTDGSLPDEVRESVEAWAGCSPGALEERECLEKMRCTGFEQVEVIAKQSAVSLNSYANVQLDSITVRAYKSRQ